MPAAAGKHSSTVPAQRYPGCLQACLPTLACPLPCRCRVPHFALVSAQGANARVWASDWKLFHGLLYMKTKGQVGLGRRQGACGLGGVCDPQRSIPTALGRPSGDAPPCLQPPLALGPPHKTKPAQAEEAVRAQRFPHAAILRPGLLERGELARGMERAIARVMSSVKVRQGLRGRGGGLEGRLCSGVGAE